MKTLPCFNCGRKGVIFTGQDCFRICCICPYRETWEGSNCYYYMTELSSKILKWNNYILRTQIL